MSFVRGKSDITHEPVKIAGAGDDILMQNISLHNRIFYWFGVPDKSNFFVLFPEAKEQVLCPDDLYAWVQDEGVISTISLFEPFLSKIAGGGGSGDGALVANKIGIEGDETQELLSELKALNELKADALKLSVETGNADNKAVLDGIKSAVESTAESDETQAKLDALKTSVETGNSDNKAVLDGIKTAVESTAESDETQAKLDALKTSVETGNSDNKAVLDGIKTAVESTTESDETQAKLDALN